MGKAGISWTQELLQDHAVITKGLGICMNAKDCLGGDVNILRALMSDLVGTFQVHVDVFVVIKTKIPWKVTMSSF